MLGLPAVRVRFYLAVVTLGFLEIIQILIEQTPSITGGVRGLSAPRPELFGFKLRADLYFYYVVLAVTVVMTYAAAALLNSPTGRKFNASRPRVGRRHARHPRRGSEIDGLHRRRLLRRHRRRAFRDLGRLHRSAQFGVGTAIRHVIFIVVGGLGSIAGSVVGALSLTMLPELLRDFKEYNEFVYGGLLLLVLVVMPHGLVGLGAWFRERALRLPFRPRASAAKS